MALIKQADNIQIHGSIPARATRPRAARLPGAGIDRPTRFFIDDGGDLFGRSITTEPSPSAISARCRAMPSPRPFWRTLNFPVSLVDAIKNMAVIEAIFHSANSGQWISPSDKRPTLSGIHQLLDLNLVVFLLTAGKGGTNERPRCWRSLRIRGTEALGKSDCFRVADDSGLIVWLKLKDVHGLTLKGDRSHGVV